jgi:hypothetical protein
MHQVALLTRQMNQEDHPMTVDMIPVVRQPKTLKKHLITLPAVKQHTSGNITDNNASSRVDQFAASLSAKNSYDQYTNSRTRSHEYSEMASRTQRA